MNFTDKIRHLIREANLSDEQAARRIGGVSDSKVRRWRHGAQPSLADAARVAAAFGVPLEYLADDRAEPPPPSRGAAAAEEEAVLIAFRSLRARHGLTAQRAVDLMVGDAGG